MTQRRIYQNNYPYFITTNTKHRYCLFDELDYAKRLSKNIFKFNEKFSSSLYTFCIMPNHLHLLIEFLNENDISNFMREVKSSFTKNLREKHNLNIQLWHKRFYEKVIEDKMRFLNTKKYILKNPMKEELPKKYTMTPYMYLDRELFIRRLGQY